MKPKIINFSKNPADIKTIGVDVNNHPHDIKTGAPIMYIQPIEELKDKTSVEMSVCLGKWAFRYDMKWIEIFVPCSVKKTRDSEGLKLLKKYIELCKYIEKKYPNKKDPNKIKCFESVIEPRGRVSFKTMIDRVDHYSFT